MPKILLILCALTISACTNQHHANSDSRNVYRTEPNYNYHQYGTELRAIDQQLQQLNTHDGMHDAERVNLEDFRQGLINQESKDCKSGQPGLTKCN